MSDAKWAIFHCGNPCPDDDERAVMSMHAQDYFRSAGIEYEACEPNSYHECWHLYNVKNLPEPLPRWFSVPDGEALKTMMAILAKRK